MPAEARREQLLDVTKAIVLERGGFHAVSIEGVARDAGISRPIVYVHFDDLRGLLEALVAREGARALAQLQEVLPPVLEGDRREALVARLAAYLEAVRADPDTWRLVLMPPEGAPRTLHEGIALGRAALVTQLAEALGPGVDEGFQAPDPELAAHLLTAFADEAARLLLADPERYPAERMLELARWFMGRLAP
jgi:AcrR family transcriptional regulator